MSDGIGVYSPQQSLSLIHGRLDLSIASDAWTSTNRELPTNLKGLETISVHRGDSLAWPPAFVEITFHGNNTKAGTTITPGIAMGLFEGYVAAIGSIGFGIFLAPQIKCQYMNFWTFPILRVTIYQNSGSTQPFIMEYDYWID